MKKIILSLAAVAALLTLNSCEDLEQDPISTGSTNTFYRPADDFSQAINSVYSSLRAFPDRALTMSETRSDNIYGVSTQGIRVWEPINNFSTAIVSNTYPDDTWSSDYVGVYRANVVIDQLAKNGTVIADTAVRSRTEGEARFLRAFFYLDLVRYFGKVPLVTTPAEPQEVAKIQRTPVAEVYNLIISDLQFASKRLPLSYTGTNIGRITAGAAKGLLALTYLTRSGSTYNIESPGLGTNDYAAANTLLDEVIASNQYQLLANTGTANGAYASVFSYTNENNREVLFDIQYASGGTGIGASYPSILVTNNYFASIGVGTTFGTGDELRAASDNLLNTYLPNDVRKTFSLQVGFTGGGATEQRAAFKKYIDGARRGNTRTDWPINFIVMRYADILLMKAECIIRGGVSGSADALVNQVRNRAFASNQQPAPLAGVTLAQLMEERRREFVGEGTRWHDLVRSGLAVTTMNNWITAEDARNRIRKPINANDLLYPVPQSQLAASSYSYGQNPGY